MVKGIGRPEFVIHRIQKRGKSHKQFIVSGTLGDVRA